MAISFCATAMQSQSIPSSSIIYLSRERLLSATPAQRELTRTQIETGTPVIYEGPSSELITGLRLPIYDSAIDEGLQWFALLKLGSGVYKKAYFTVARELQEEFPYAGSAEAISFQGNSVKPARTDEELSRAKQILINHATTWATENLTAFAPKSRKVLDDPGAWNAIEELSYYQYGVGDDGLEDCRITLTVMTFKIPDSFPDRDWYLVETKLHHQVNVTSTYQQHWPSIGSTGYVGWYAQDRELKDSLVSGGTLADYGPTGTQNSSTTTISVGGSIGTDGAGGNCGYSKAYSTQDVNTTDYSSYGSAFGYWKERIMCPRGDYSLWPIVDWPCNNSKGSFQSYQVMILKTTDLWTPVTVVLKPRAKIYKDKIKNWGVYYDLTRTYYDLNFSPTVNIRKNNPPSPPHIPSGPSEGWVNEAYTFSTGSRDLDGNPLDYSFDWQDAQGSYGDSSQQYSWGVGGLKGVRAKAKDSPYGDESEWSTTFNIFIKAISRIEISGPSEINSNSYGQYTCTAHYNNSSETSIDPSWSISSGSQYASINSAGVLTPNNVTQDQTVTIRAEYTDHGIPVSMSKSIAIKMVTSADEPEGSLPGTYVLFQAYPNPFNPATTIKFGLPSESRVTFRIFDLAGREVQSLMNKPMDAGYHSVKWSAKSATTGVYYYRLDATSVSDPTKTFTQTRKMVLMR
jgi:hypothetical protein